MNTALSLARRSVRRRAYWVYVLSQTRRILQMRRNAAQARAQSGLQLISHTPAFDRQSDTLFILGSGASINELDTDFWKYVAKHDSIGFNNWMVHDFVPDFYMREFPLEISENKNFAKIFRENHKKYDHVPFLLRRGFTQRRAAIWPEALALFQSLVAGPLCLPDVVNVPAETEAEMRSFCRLWRKLGLHRNVDVHIDCRASVSQLIYFGLVQGYRNIVLCGIDLNTKAYFWEDDRWTGSRVNLPPNNSATAQHRTMDPKLGLPIDKIMAAMHDELLKPAGVQLYVARPSSALAAFLPVYALPTAH